MYPSPIRVRVSKSRRLRWVGHVTRMEESRSAFKMLRGTPTRKIRFGKSKRRLKDNNRMDLKENRYQHDGLG